MHRKIATWFMLVVMTLVPVVGFVSPVTAQGGTSDVAIVTTENGQPVYDVCFVLANFSNEGCDENRDGKITFQDIPLGTYTLRQTRDLGSGRSTPDTTIAVTGVSDSDGWERFYVSVSSSGSSGQVSQNGDSDVAVVTTEGGQPIFDACYVLVNFSNEGCDENRDGKITFQDIPLGTYTLHQTRDLGPGRSIPDSTIQVTGMVDTDGWERFYVSVGGENDTSSSDNSSSEAAPSAQLANAIVSTGSPTLPPGIVRLPFDGKYEIMEVPGCGWHNRNNKNYETGYNVSPESQEQNDRAFDFGLPDGTPVLAAGEGDIISRDVIGGALRIGIAHGRWEGSTFVHNGVQSYYLHLQEFDDGAQVGAHVGVGQLIGLSGRSGGVPPHLHFSVTINGEAANINGLPGIEWDTEQLNENGYAICNRNAKDFAVGGAVATAPEVSVPEDDSGSSAPADNAMMTVVGYDRNEAVRAAYDNLHRDYVYENDSAWYASNVLWAGGLPSTDEWENSTAWPQDLVNYLISSHRLDEQSSYTPATMTQLSWSDNPAGGAMLGDLIAYDWDGDRIVDHVAVITNLNEQGYPEVCEHSPTHENRYWTYSISADNWIESAYPGSVAYLIHISPMTVPDF